MVPSAAPRAPVVAGFLPAPAEPALSVSDWVGAGDTDQEAPLSQQRPAL